MSINEAESTEQLCRLEPSEHVSQLALTTLQAAAYRGDVENVELLLDHGALLNTEPIGYYGNELQGSVCHPWLLIPCLSFMQLLSIPEMRQQSAF